MNYIFNTNPNSETEDDIHVAGSSSYFDGNKDLIIHTDAGDENSWTYEKWDFRYSGIAICVESNHHDDPANDLESVADRCFDDFIGDSMVVDIKTFELRLKAHIKANS